MQRKRITCLPSLACSRRKAESNPSRTLVAVRRDVKAHCASCKWPHRAVQLQGHSRSWAWPCRCSLRAAQPLHRADSLRLPLMSNVRRAQRQNRMKHTYWALACAMFTCLRALAQVPTTAEQAQLGAALSRAKEITVMWWIGIRPDERAPRDGATIKDPFQVEALRKEVLRLSKIGKRPTAGAEGPRDYAGYWCAAYVVFEIAPPSKPGELDGKNVWVCGRPGRFLVRRTEAFPHSFELQQPRGEISQLLKLAGIPELPDCPETPFRRGHGYEKFDHVCW